MLHKMKKDIEHKIFFTIPIADPPPPQYFVYAESDRWLGAGAVCEMNFRDLLLPQRHASHTDLLDLNPLPKSALRCPDFEALYPRFSHFNAIQTQVSSQRKNPDSQRKNPDSQRKNPDFPLRKDLIS